MRRRREVAGLLAAAVVALLAPAAADAAVSSVLAGQTVSGTAITCTTQSDGVRVCAGDINSPDTRLKSFDGTPLALDVILPPAPASGTDGSYPLVVQSHGWGSKASGPANAEYLGPTGDQWAREGYAVLQLTARGFGDSCGSAASRMADPSGCVNGYIRLDDDRYEVRDIQYAIGLLVDEGLIDPHRIGVTGESYGGGVSLQLATLKDRVMNPDGSLSPWQSPGGTPLSIAAAAPVIPWSDLVYSLLPNGRTTDSAVASPTTDLSPLGVEKQSYVSGLFAVGASVGFYSVPGANPEADLTTWFGSLNAGEPYDSNPEDQMIASTIARYHSAYYLLDGAYGVAPEPPPPLLIANGFTDDLFPVDEALRYYNLERSQYPSDPISLFDFDGGHSRGQNKAADLALLAQQIQALFDAYVKGGSPPPAPSATALTQTCPTTAPSGGPFTAATWSGLHPGTVDFSSAPAQTITSGAGSAAISSQVDPIAGGGACVTVPAADQGAGVATYRLPPAYSTGYTLLGAATVTANLSPTGTFPQIAARLWDVNPTAGTETLVARGLYRVAAGGVQTFQLHPGAWHFAAGHIPKLELLGQDTPYGRTSNGQFAITVSGLSLQLPVHEASGAPPPPPGGSVPGPSGCRARPAAHIARRTVRRHKLLLTGTASERPCAGAAAAIRGRERVSTVRIAIFRHSGRRRCRFVLPSGHLSRARPCTRTITLRARGTRRWQLRLRLHLPRGAYTVNATAVDGLRTRQARPGRATIHVR